MNGSELVVDGGDDRIVTESWESPLCAARVTRLKTVVCTYGGTRKGLMTKITTLFGNY